VISATSRLRAEVSPQRPGPVAEDQIRLLFITKDTVFSELVGQALGWEFSVKTVADYAAEDLSEVCLSGDVILLDLRTPEVGKPLDSELVFIDRLNQVPCHPPAVILCDDNHQGMREALRHGAYDSLSAPPSIAELRLILRRAFKDYVAQQELHQLRASARTAGRLHELLGTSPAMQELFALAHKIASCDVNVLIIGETGTGKELLARAIHHMSTRSAKPFVAFSCANLPETLIEDELFGHEKGAFTGALAARRGRFEAAEHGTLFLDEIGDLSMGLQPKLLRVLQERRFERLGGSTTINVDVRLICATHRNLHEMVKQGTFREDLFYRLDVVQMVLPPLRDRREDISLLAQHFLQTVARQFNKSAKRFSPAALRALEEHSWPGNVRELENVVQRAVVLAENATVDVCHLPAALWRVAEDPLTSKSYEAQVRQFKKRLVLQTLRECGWSKAEAARSLGVARSYLHRLISQLEIREPQDQPVLAVSSQQLSSAKQVM
jgi:two-component system, NtrC family, response regulator AtoC